ncbi:MAG: YbjN domain-containing protein [Armatimonadetes bacterium]|nr:YbjN domain-containing protein [Armatimonadota bacterium]
MHKTGKLCLVALLCGSLALAASGSLKKGTKALAKDAPRTHHAFTAQPAGRLQFVADEAPALVTSTSLDEMRDACKELKLKPEDAKDQDGDPMLLVDMDGYKVGVLLYGKPEVTSIGLQCNLKMDKAPSLSMVNEWNIARRYSRVYVKDGICTLEDDLDLEGGVTWETVGRIFVRFQDSVAELAKHIGFKLE